MSNKNLPESPKPKDGRAAAVKKKRNRKTKDVYKITKTLLNKVEMLAANGLSLEQIAVSIGWVESTIHKKKNESKELSEAIKRGQAKGIQTVANSLFKRANGYRYTETHTETKEIEIKGQKGEPIAAELVNTKTVQKHEAGNTTAQIFYLTNRDPENWKHKSEQVLSGELAMTVGAIKKEDVKKVKDIFDNITE